MNLLLLLALSLHASTYESIRDSSGEQGKMLMTAAQFTQWVSDFKTARAKAAACVTIAPDQLPGLIGTANDEKFDLAAKSLYQPAFPLFAGRLDADLAHMTGPIGHSYEKPGCGLWGLMSELSAMRRQVEAHAEAVMTSYWRARLNGRDFAVYTPEKRKAWLEDGFLDDYKNAVTAAADAGELDVVRQGLESNSALRRRATNWSIFALRDKRFSPEMEKSLDSEVVDTRMEAVYYFYALKEPRVVDKVAAMAGDGAVKIRQVVALYLGGVKASKHKAVLEKLAGDADPHVRQMAADALKSLQ